MKKISNWSVRFDDSNPYRAPEMRDRLVVGDVDGKMIGIVLRHSRIDGRKIFCSDGQEFFLGKIDPKYRDLLSKNNYPYDMKNPIKTKKHNELTYFKE